MKILPGMRVAMEKSMLENLLVDKLGDMYRPAPPGRCCPRFRAFSIVDMATLKKLHGQNPRGAEVLVRCSGVLDPWIILELLGEAVARSSSRW